MRKCLVLNLPPNYGQNYNDMSDLCVNQVFVEDEMQKLSHIVRAQNFASFSIRVKMSNFGNFDQTNAFLRIVKKYMPQSLTLTY